MKQVPKSLALLSALAAAVVAMLAFGAAPAFAHPCAGGVAEHAHTGEAEHEHECVIENELAEEYAAVDTTDAAADPVEPAVASFEKSENMTALGYSARNVPFSGTGSSQFNSDWAFQGNYAYQGTYDGFRIIDVSNPAAPTQVVNYIGCSSAAGQGDVLVYGNLLIRSWDSPVSAAAAPTARCGGQLVGQGFEGVHVFDISDKANPVLVKQIRMAADTTPTRGCGSHTATLVPDAARGNLYVYSNGSNSNCQGIDIIRIPLSAPAESAFLGRAAAGRQCHDTAVFLADVNLAACAGGNGFSVFSFNPALPADAPGGLANPTLLYSKPITGVGIAHSTSFSWDGRVLIFGHEPGGGSQAQCQATSSVVNRTLFFFDPRTGDEKGRFVQPRPQTNRENCTWHNFNVVPTNRAYVAVVGSYQMGITVIDFTDQSNIQQIAYADPAPLSTTSTILGGDWSTYWYNGLIYESDIRRGAIIWRLDDRRVQGARTFALSNPQTQEVSFGLDRTKPRVISRIPAQVGLSRTVAASYTCVDDQGPETSGIFACEGSVANGASLDTSSIGTKTITVRAEDGAGNVETVTISYDVIWDQYAGFFRPVGETNTPNAGRAVPVKFSLGADYGLNVIAEGYPKTKACGASDDTLVSTSSTEPLSFADGQYTYTWKTEKAWAGQCRELVVKLADNTVHTATFRFPA